MDKKEKKTIDVHTFLISFNNKIDRKCISDDNHMLSAIVFPVYLRRSISHFFFHFCPFLFFLVPVLLPDRHCNLSYSLAILATVYLLVSPVETFLNLINPEISLLF